MPNPRGVNQYTKGRGKGAPKMGAAAKKMKAAGITGRLSNKKPRGKAVDTFYGGSKRKLNG